ncbi:MAG TPA: glycosyltransferase [Ramlibacter sp.]|nr:glycosyltransferase [Ramlibacter sp.]
MRFSLVIPARNEEAYLPRLLETVAAARGRYRGGADAVEVIVADNCSTDRTTEIARQHGCRVVRVERRVIGAVRNGGAHAAQGEVLALVDADSRIHPETFNAIEDMLARPRIIAGATGIVFERISLGIALSGIVFLPLVWLTGFDVGVVSCRKVDFETIGGYREDVLFAEDMHLLMALRRLGRARGQRLGRARSARTIASTRKFDRYGDWHYFRIIWRGGLALLRQSHSADDMAREYWYSDR